MKWLVSVALALAAATSLAAAQQQKPAVSAVPDFLPTAAMDEYAVTGDSHRVYYSTLKGEIWLYDRLQKKSSRIADGGEVWDITVAPNGSAVAFVRGGETKKGESVWTVPLDPRTGLATGAQRRISMLEGDSPSFSPDGQLLAFGRADSGWKQSLVVLPAAGGPERVLASFPEGFNVIRWTPDAKTIYLSSNAYRSLGIMDEHIQKVSVAGGTPTRIAESGYAFPGLSPDGKTIVFQDTGLTRAYVVADTTGKRLATFVTPPGMDIGLWIGQSTLLIERERNPWGLHAYTIADGRTRTVVDTIGQIQAQRWSPDGKRIAYALQVGRRFALVVADASGATSRVIPLQRSVGNGMRWSPDGRWILPRWANASPTIAVEISSGKQAEVPDTRQGSLDWSSDSRHIINVGNLSTPAVATPPEPLVVREADVSGSSRIVREIPTPVGRRLAVPVDERSLIVMRGPGQPIVLESLNGTGKRVQVLPATTGFFAEPMVSDDRKWVAFRRNTQSDDNTKLNIVEVVRLDGSGHTTLNLPFFAAGGDNLYFLAGDRQLVIAENSRGQKNPSVYLVTVATGEVKKLFGLRLLPNQVPQISVSPDGKTILYVNRDSQAASYATLDLSHVAGAKR